MEESLELSFTIRNDAVSSKRCVLFGGNIMLSQQNFGSQAGITVTPSFGVSYVQVLLDTIKFPFEIGYIRVQSLTTPDQVGAGISVVSSDIYGDDLVEAISMIGLIDEYQEQISIVTLKKSVAMNGDKFLSFFILPTTRLFFSIGIKRKINGNRLLHNLSPIVNYKEGGTIIKPLYTLVQPLELKK